MEVEAPAEIHGHWCGTATGRTRSGTGTSLTSSALSARDFKSTEGLDPCFGCQGCEI